MPKSKEFISDSESASGSEDEQPKKKKAKKEPEKKKKASAKASGSGDETMFQLGKMKYATVSEFRGKKMVNIREYYEKDGEMLPGRKGIALMPDQWKRLKDQVEEIDEALENL